MIDHSLLMNFLLIACAVVGFIIGLRAFFLKAKQGQALVRTGLGGTKVSFSGIFALPILHRLEVLDLTMKKIVVNRTGSESLCCKDDKLAEMKTVFYIQVNYTLDDVKYVSSTIGCDMTFDLPRLQSKFEPKFSQALEAVCRDFNAEDIYDSREQFMSKLLDYIGMELDGYVLSDFAITQIKPLPKSTLAL